MEISILKTSPRSVKDKREKNYSDLKFDLPVLIENMKRGHSWKKGELISMILLNRPGKQILLTALHDKTEVNSYQSGDSVKFQIIEGKLMFHCCKESVILNKGQLLTLHENAEYSLISLEETVFLLTISDSGAKIAGNKVLPCS